METVMNLFTAKALHFQKGNKNVERHTVPDQRDSELEEGWKRDREADHFELDLEEELLLQQQLEQQTREDEEMFDY